MVDNNENENLVHQHVNDLDIDDETYYRRRLSSTIHSNSNDEGQFPTMGARKQSKGRARSHPVLPFEKQIILRNKSSSSGQDQNNRVNRYSRHEVPKDVTINDDDIRKLTRLHSSKSEENIRKPYDMGPEEGLTAHSLYKEAVYTALHMLGKSTERLPGSSDEMLMYAHVIFSNSLQEQLAVGNHVSGEPFPITIVNARIIRGEGISSRELTEANPYCVIKLETIDSRAQGNWQIMSGELSSNVDHGASNKRVDTRAKKTFSERKLDQQYAELPTLIKTSIQYQTSNPVWNQRFQCLGTRPSSDLFTIEVWDHDDEKSTLHALKNAKEAKRAKIVKGGLENELEDAFYRGKRDNFLGEFTLKIMDLPCDGTEIWFSLTGLTHRGFAAKGRILLQIWLTHAYRHGQHYEFYAEPRITLERLWHYIVDVESQQPEGAMNWNGIIPPTANSLLFQYALQTGISESSQGLIRWQAYAKHSLELTGITLSLADLRKTVNKSTNEKLADWRVSEIETTLFTIVLDKLCPVLRNHLLGETQLRVQQAVDAIQHCLNVLKRFKSFDIIHRINLLVIAYLKLAVLDWYEVKYAEIVISQIRKNMLQYETVQLYEEMIRQVNQIMNEGESVWSVLFWMEGFIDYMPIMYCELQKMIIFDIEELAWHVSWNDFQTNAKLRRTLLRLDSNVEKFCQHLYHLFHEVQLFALRRNKIPTMTEKQFHLQDYHLWFRQLLVLWLGFVFIQVCKKIEKSILIDDIMTEDEYVKTSSSALDTRVALLQLDSFWTELNWPDVAENYIIGRFLMEVISYVGILYANLKTKKIEREGYFDTVDRFDISERLCVALNNIETVKDAVLNSFLTFNTMNQMSELERAIGINETLSYQNNIQEMLTNTTQAIDEKIGMIFLGMKHRLSPEIRSCIEEYLVFLSQNSQHNHANDGLDKLIGYFEDNFVILQKRVIPTIFPPVLQVFWKAICDELVAAIQQFPLKDSILAQREILAEIETMMDVLIDYFKGGGSGLDDKEIQCEEYIAADQFIKLFQYNTTTLIGMYFQEKGETQFEPHSQKYGSLQCRTSYWNGKLNVEIISGQNLIGADPVLLQKLWNYDKNKKVAALSDCKVQIELVPPKMFSNCELQETTTKWHTVNPIFNESFSWQISGGECQQPNATLRFTVKDVDITSKNDFLGEAFVPISQLPGVGNANVIQQPMNLFLRSKDYNRTSKNIVSVLRCRRWDVEANEFLADEEKRYVDETLLV